MNSRRPAWFYYPGWFGAISLFIALDWLYTVIGIRLMSAQRIFANPEEGMLAHTLPYFENRKKSEFPYTGPNAFEGNQPPIWYIWPKTQRWPSCWL